MDISRAEQRILHLLAQGGFIEIAKQNKTVAGVRCFNRDGWHFPGLDVDMFRKLKRRRTIASHNGGPYRITRRGPELVRSQFDNR